MRETKVPLLLLLAEYTHQPQIVSRLPHPLLTIKKSSPESLESYVKVPVKFL